VHTVLQALTEKIRQIDCSVDTDRFELYTIVGSLWEFGFWEDAVFGNYRLIPWVTFYEAAEK